MKILPIIALTALAVAPVSNVYAQAGKGGTTLGGDAKDNSASGGSEAGTTTRGKATSATEGQTEGSATTGAASTSVRGAGSKR